MDVRRKIRAHLISWMRMTTWKRGHPKMDKIEIEIYANK